MKKTKIKKEDCHFNYSFESNPTELEFFEDLPIEIDGCQLNNSLCLFKSIDDILVISYFTFWKNPTCIISYNIIDKKIIHKIKGFDSIFSKIIHISHYLDKNSKRDLLLQIECGKEEVNKENRIYIWDFRTLDCILCLDNIYKEGCISSASFLNEKSQLYLITSNKYGKSFSLPLKVFDIKGSKVKEINNIKSDINYIDIYYDKNLKKNFIVLIDRTLSSYDYTTNKLYKKYCDKKLDPYGDTVNINAGKKIVKIMVCDHNGYIKIFNFHTKELLFESRAGGSGFCYWNDQYIFAYEKYDKFVLIDSISLVKKKFFEGHKNTIFKLVKFIHPKYGECLITVSERETKLWIIKKETTSIQKK